MTDSVSSVLNEIMREIVSNDRVVLLLNKFYSRPNHSNHKRMFDAVNSEFIARLYRVRGLSYNTISPIYRVILPSLGYSNGRVTVNVMYYSDVNMSTMEYLNSNEDSVYSAWVSGASDISQTFNGAVITGSMISGISVQIPGTTTGFGAQLLAGYSEELKIALSTEFEASVAALEANIDAAINAAYAILSAGDYITSASPTEIGHGTVTLAGQFLSSSAGAIASSTPDYIQYTTATLTLSSISNKYIVPFFTSNGDNPFVFVYVYTNGSFVFDAGTGSVPEDFYTSVITSISNSESTSQLTSSNSVTITYLGG
jgi:hypothetical protein